MKKSAKKLVSIVFLTIIWVQLVACGKTAKTSGEEVSKYVYVAEYQTLPEAEYFDNICITNDKMFYTYSEWDEETEISTTTLYSLIIGESEASVIPFSLGEDSHIYNLRVDAEGNIWVLINTYVSDESNIEGGTSTFELVKIDEKGNQLNNVDITLLLEEEEQAYVQYLELDGAGNIYFSNSESTIWVLDPQGILLFTLSVDNYINGISCSKDGTVMVSQYGNEGEELKPIDVVAKSFGDSYTEVPSSNGNTSIVPGIHSDLLINTGSSLVEYNLQTKEQSIILNWIDCDINSNYIRAVRELEDGKVVAVTSDYSGESSITELIFLTKTEASEVKVKTTLTFGTMYLRGDVETAIINFNKTNETYRITVKEYNNDSDDYEGALAQFNSDIATGSGPDIIDLSNGVSVSNYASKGVFEDIYPYIERDSEINLDNYLTNIISAYEIDGKLYGMITNFDISTLIGKTADVGEKMGWKLEELVSFFESQPEGTTMFRGATKSSILSTLVMYDMNQFMNFDTGECSFNSESFEKILEFANKFDAEYTYKEDEPSEPTLIQSGQQLFMNTNISSIQEFQMYRLMFGEDITFIGYPSETGNGSIINPSVATMAMNSNSNYKDGAWEFMRYFLSEEYQTNDNHWSFPVLKSALNTMFEEALEPFTYEDENGNLVEESRVSWSYDDWDAEIFAATEEEISQMEKLISSVETVNYYNEEVYSIISEEAEALFSGSKKAKEVAEIIQSRVQIYVNETK